MILHIKPDRRKKFSDISLGLSSFHLVNQHVFIEQLLCAWYSLREKTAENKKKKKKIPASKLYSNREEIDTLNKKEIPYILFNQSHLKEAL